MSSIFSNAPETVRFRGMTFTSHGKAFVTEPDWAKQAGRFWMVVSITAPKRLPKPGDTVKLMMTDDEGYIYPGTVVEIVEWVPEGF